MSRLRSPIHWLGGKGPYPLSTRKSGGYRHELTEDEHRELTERLLQVQGKVLLSTYPSGIHAPLRRAGWRCRQWATVCHAVGRTRRSGLRGMGAIRRAQRRMECLWRNTRALVRA